MGENKTTLDTLLGFDAGMKEANDLLRPGDILPPTADRPECVVVARGKAPLDAYNEGLGDGLVYATAIMGSSSQETINKLRAGVEATRAALQEQEKADG